MPKQQISGVQTFTTGEGLLAFCLYMAGAEFAYESRPCFHLYDPEILSGLGYKGQPLWESAQHAWKGQHEPKRGKVEWAFKLSQRTHDLILVYRAQKKELEEGDGKACDVIRAIKEKERDGHIQWDEAIVRECCVFGFIRRDFMNDWKKIVPWLNIPKPGKAKHFDTTVTVNTADGIKTIPAKGVRHPGYTSLPLTATEETRRKFGFRE